jgi:hypothetical protein
MSDTEMVLSALIIVIVFVGKCYAISKLGK